MLPRDTQFIGKPCSAADLNALLRQFRFKQICRGGRKHFQSYEEGIGIICRDGVVRAIYYCSSEEIDFDEYAGPLPLDLTFSMTASEVRQKLGVPAAEIEPRMPEHSFGHGGIDRYDLGVCALAVCYSAHTGRVVRVILEDRSDFLDHSMPQQNE
jgi:hypothetical protein